MKAKMTEEVEQIKKNIEYGLQHIKGKDDGGCTSAVLFLGNSGAGKTTLINYLIGNELVVIKKGFPPKKVLDVKTPVNGLEIGHAIESKTTLPNFWKFEHEGKKYALWDCPGFGDNRGAVQDISNAYYIKMLFEKYSNLKIILTIPESSLSVNNGRAEGFLKLVKNFSTLFVDDSYKYGTYFVITKSTTDDFDALADCLTESQSAFQKEEELMVLNYFIDKTKNKEVLLHSDASLEKYLENEERNIILNKIIKSHHFITDPEIQYPLSAETKNIISDLRDEIWCDVRDNMEQVNNVLRDFAANLAHSNVQQVNKSVAALNKIKAHINNIYLMNKDDGEIVKSIKTILQEANSGNKGDKILKDINSNTETLYFFKDLQAKSTTQLKDLCFKLLSSVDEHLLAFNGYKDEIFQETMKNLKTELQSAVKENNLVSQKLNMTTLIGITDNGDKVVKICKDLISLDIADVQSYRCAIDKMLSIARYDDFKYFYTMLIDKTKNINYCTEAIGKVNSEGLPNKVLYLKYFHDKKLSLSDSVENYKLAIDDMKSQRNSSYTADYYEKMIKKAGNDDKVKDYYYDVITTMQQFHDWSKMKSFAENALKLNGLNMIYKNNFQNLLSTSEEALRPKPKQEPSWCSIMNAKMVHDNPFLNLDQNKLTKLISDTGFSYNELLNKTNKALDMFGSSLLEIAINSNDLTLFSSLIGNEVTYEA